MDEKEKATGEMQEVRIVVEHIHVYRYPRWRVRMPRVYVRTKRQEAGRWTYHVWQTVMAVIAALAVALEIYVLMLPAFAVGGWAVCMVHVMAVAAGAVVYRVLTVDKARKAREVCADGSKRG